MSSTSEEGKLGIILGKTNVSDGGRLFFIYFGIVSFKLLSFVY